MHNQNNATESNNILVLGSGVIGLTCAISILESNLKNKNSSKQKNVWIWTEDLPLNTTSVVAGAIWGPYHVEPQDKCDRWAMQSVPIFDQIAASKYFGAKNQSTETGVYRCDGYVYEREKHEKPSWLHGNEQLFKYKRVNHKTGDKTGNDGMLFPTDYIRKEFSSVYELNLPMIDMPLYLTYLERRFFESGGRGIIQRKITHIDQVSHYETLMNQKFDMIVNCTGFGSRQLFNDHQVVADRGQLVLIQLPTDKPGVFGADALKGRYYDAAEPKAGCQPTYILPRRNNIYICGGCSIVLSDEEMKAPKAELCVQIARNILANCDQLVPHANILSTAKIVGHITAWRPFRKGGVRLELAYEGEKQRPVIHCYGFGGAGVTLSWGVAFEVNDLLESFMREPTQESKHPRARL